MSTKTDLAKEIIDRISPCYAKKTEDFFESTKIHRIDIETDDEERLIGKPKGRYVTIEAESIHPPFEKFDEEAFAVANELRSLLPKRGNILFIGIGNPALTADSLGPETARLLPCGKLFGKRLCAFSPGVSGATGIDTFLLIKALVRELKPDGVIALDSLAAEEISHICRSIQLTNSGIEPGSGLCRRSEAISEETLGIPVIGMGTPTVIRFPDSDSVFVSPNDMDILIKKAAKLFAAAVFLAVFPEVDIETAKDMIF